MPEIGLLFTGKRSEQFSNGFDDVLRVAIEAAVEVPSREHDFELGTVNIPFPDPWDSRAPNTVQQIEGRR